MLLFVILTSICAVYFIKWYSGRSRIIKCLERFKGPKPLPILGNGLELLSKPELLEKLLKYAQEYGTVVKIWMGPTPSILVVQDVKLLEFLLTSTKILSKAAEYDYIKGWIGNGILANPGDARWTKHRKILNPAFNYNVLEKFIPVFTSNCDILVKTIEKEIGNTSFDISTVMKLYALDNTCECAMGIPVNALVNSDCQLVKDVSTMCDILMTRAFNPILKPDILFRFTPYYSRQQAAFKRLNDNVSTVISNRRDKFHGGEKGEDEYGKKRRLAFLDLLLNESKNDPSLTDAHIREEVATFMFAGHETTQAALSFCLYSLSEHQDIQERVVEELQEVFADNLQKSITLTDINKMRYMEAVMKEIFRLYPPVPMFGRTTLEDLEYDGAIIPKGISLFLNTYSLHRDPNLYDNPLVFDPERFITGGAPKSPYAYLPFSAGPRDCIGRKFAMIEIKLTLATLLRNFKFLPAHPKHKLVLVDEAVLTSQTGVHIQIQRRIL